jgi:putative phosphoesterase
LSRVAIVSDTHMPKGRRELPARCVELCRASDLILHCGDVNERAVLEAFEGFGPPVLAVRGNVDSPDLCALLPETRTVEVAGSRIAMVHDAGPKKGRLKRLRERFPGHDATVFGHSHLPLHETGDDGFQIFNPGSPTERRRAPFKSMGIARVEAGRVSFELVDLGT